MGPNLASYPAQPNKVQQEPDRHRREGTRRRRARVRARWSVERYTRESNPPALPPACAAATSSSVASAPALFFSAPPLPLLCYAPRNNPKPAVSFEHLSEELIIKILKKITRTSDLNSLSLVSKQLYTIDAEQRAAIRLGCGLATEDFLALCSRFPNLLKALSSLFINDCKGIAGSTEWLEYLGTDGSLEELVVNNCQGISQYDFLKFGRGWMKLKKFEFENKESLWKHFGPSHDSSYNANCVYKYDLCCQNLEDLRLARLITEPEGPEIGLRFLPRKCKALERLCLEYMLTDMIVLSQSCKNLKSISLWMIPGLFHEPDGIVFRMGLTEESLEALANNCHLLQDVELVFTGVEHWKPPEIGFTQEGLVKLMHYCPIRALTLNGALFFNDKGMKGLSSAPFLETHSLIDSKEITDY
uniref:F-box domain-containing protein n=1 Tax=Oryza nivara TaxID=4536 RepID=A0A0E0GZQ6_ORYNI